MANFRDILKLVRKSTPGKLGKAPKSMSGKTWETLKGDNIRRATQRKENFQAYMMDNTAKVTDKAKMGEKLDFYHHSMNKLDGELKKERMATGALNTAAALGAGYGVMKGVEHGQRARMDQDFYGAPKLASVTNYDPPNIPTATSAPAVNRPEDYADYYDWQEWETSDRTYPDRENHPQSVLKTASTEEMIEALGIDLDTRIAMYEMNYNVPAQMDKVAGISSIMTKAKGYLTSAGSKAGASTAAKSAKSTGSRLLGGALLTAGTTGAGYAAGRISEAAKNYVPDYYR